MFAGVADGTGDRKVRGDPELVAGDRRLREPEHLHGHRGEGLFDLVAVVVDQRLHPTPCGTGHDRFANAERPALHDDRRDRPTADVEVRLEHDASRIDFGVGTQLEHLGKHDELL